ncbi:precorrin-6A reductase [Sporanaerobium hydrogeniformans]|uniref:Precorrin-6A reductase n=1 Tax=Sporanaerobium hydrogeniformans TaxID=3072179 RepID=A0AC61DE26_9FIRM|nr:precorrin-6A reductase [Sporanaerobium hydrogeniformans]PHV70986.1 precorrin-6A reductase [Sporanaerobium hydrogeniformans]
MILVLGGTSDSLQICERLNKRQQAYLVSVTSAYGKELCLPYTDQVQLGKMNEHEMKSFLLENHIETVIDATHPYAIEVSQIAQKVTQALNVTYKRYERPSLLEEMSYSKLHVVSSLEEACELVASLGERIFLATGSKHLAFFKERLGHKMLFARVLPTSQVLGECEALGFQADHLIAMKGPFSEDMNRAFFSATLSDVVLTKESGKEGGFIEKVEAAKALDIPIVVIKRPCFNYRCVFHHLDELIESL